MKPTTNEAEDEDETENIEEKESDTKSATLIPKPKFGTKNENSWKPKKPKENRQVTHNLRRRMGR